MTKASEETERALLLKQEQEIRDARKRKRTSYQC